MTDTMAMDRFERERAWELLIRCEPELSGLLEALYAVESDEFLPQAKPYLLDMAKEYLDEYSNRVHQRIDVFGNSADLGG